MTRYVIDAKTLLRVLESGREVDPAHQLVAPASIRSQVMSLLLQKVRHGDLSDQEALALHERLTETRLRLLNDRVSRRTAWDLARQQGWDALDHAECIALVKLQADALITIDQDLATTASGIVPVVTLEHVFEA